MDLLTRGWIRITRVTPHMWKRTLLLLILVAADTALAHGTPPTWLEVRTQNFDLISNAGEKQARHVADQLERMRLVFHLLFPKADLNTTQPVLVLAVNDKKDFRTLEPEAYLAKGQLDLAGLFLETPDRSYVLMRLDAEGEHPYATIYHEYCHFLWRRYQQWLPLWLNEGIAEFYQNTQFFNKEVVLGEPSDYDLVYLRQHRLLPLATLLTVDQNSPYYHEEEKGSIFYSESWALVHYLSITDLKTHSQRMLDYAQLVIDQHVDSLTAAQRVFGDLKVLQKNLEAYISQQGLMAMRLKANTGVDDAAFKVQAIPQIQADAMRADFLASSGRTKDARALLGSILHVDPRNAQALETMGYLDLRDGNVKDAQDWYRQAVELDSQGFTANYYFATTSMQLGNLDSAQTPKVEASLRAAIKLNPSFAPAYDRLAVLLAMQHRSLDEAHQLELQAVTLDRANIGFRLNTAMIAQQQDRMDDAIKILQTALQVATKPEEKATVQQRLQVIEDYKEIRQRAEAQHSSEVSSAASTVTVQQTTEQAITGAPANQSVSVKILATPPKHPDEARGPRYLVSGVVRDVQCSYPTVLELKLQSGAKAVSLYSNNYYKVNFFAVNFTLKRNLNPCRDLAGLKARVTYSETSDTMTDGQIVAMELSK
jgi:tetratricopeptide (TPR) repeat protein